MGATAYGGTIDIWAAGCVFAGEAGRQTSEQKSAGWYGDSSHVVCMHEITQFCQDCCSG